MRKEIRLISGPCDETHSDEKASLLGKIFQPSTMHLWERKFVHKTKRSKTYNPVFSEFIE